MSRSEAVAHLLADRPQDAAAILEQLLEAQPQDAHAWFLLGACRQALSDLPGAVLALERSISLDPANCEAQLALVSALRASGDTAGALIASQRALTQSEDPRLLYAVAVCNDDVNQFGKALAYYEEALRRAPAMEDALHNRGLLLARVGRLDEAESNQRRYVELYPRSARAHLGLADVLVAQGRFSAALSTFDTAVDLSPDNPIAHLLRGVTLAALRRFDDARKNFTAARALDSLAVKRHLARIAPATDHNYMLSPRSIFLWQAWLALGRCDWTSWDAAISEFGQLVDGSSDAIDPAIGFAALHFPLNSGERRAVIRNIAIRIETNAPVLPPPGPRSQLRIRVGVLSPDLREHIMGRLLLPFFELLNRDRFELYAYSLMPSDGSAVGSRLVAATHKFHDLHAVTDDQVAAQIRADDIDILVDVGGYTTGARVGITARRPARVQVQYLGLAGSLGSKRVDHVITDRVAGASALEWTEDPVYLPHTYYLYDFREPVADVPVARQEYGLPESAFVYCAFHRPEKISPDTFSLWMKILRRAPQSILWLLALTGSAQRNLRKAAAAEGVDQNRLVFAPFEPRTDPRYLARHRLGDLMLDALYHNAIATACDALACALPLLTISGTSMASRSAESLLRAAKVPELVAADADAYVAMAHDLTTDRERLDGYRKTLAERRSPLFDTATRVKELEDALVHILRRHELQR